VQAAQREGADGGAQPTAAELLADTHGLELSDGVLVVEPAEAVGGEATVRSLDHTVERLAVGPL
jgi:hypothetical protein